MHQTKARFLSLQLTTAGILTLCASGAMASGFALIDQSSSLMGNAYAGGSAIASDASTVYFNPAGMTRVPKQLVGGLQFVLPQAEFNGSANDLLNNPVATGGNGGDAGDLGVIPNLYFTVPVTNKIALGLGINAPFGLSTEYDKDWVGRYEAIKSNLITININPAIAYKASNTLSVGLGVNLQYARAELTQAIDQGSLCIANQIQQGVLPGTAATNCAGLGLTPQGNDAFAKIEGDGWAGGINVGLLYEPSHATRIGLAYRSRINQQLTGNANFRRVDPLFSQGTFPIFVDTNVNASLDLPQSISLSAYHDLSARWAVMADATWTGWDSFKELRIKYDTFQPDTVTNEDWNNTMRYSLGINYTANNHWTFRSGVAFDQSPIPDNQHRTARIPGEDRTWVSVGVGYQMTQTLGIDIGYSHLFVKEPKVSSGSATSGTINGDYDASVDIASAQLVWNL